MSIDSDEFALPFFKDNGFVRRQCRVCQSYFWTQVPDKEVCGDVPCQEYEFIGNPPTRRSYSVPEIRKLFLSFFEDKGHTIIKPYPVVARWRDDVYLVGASIYDFQPYVTEGVIPPPANPLVISQPCLRFTDIDNVGPTAGRHLLIFEMGGHHAFNYPDRQLYWKDETVRYHHELLTELLGVKSQLVSYKEHFWSGGGNAGPDVEACVNGLEISTLVFMQYKVAGEKLVPLPIKTVDTGYGIERWAWLTQGSPSCFHVIYGPVLDRILDLAGIITEGKVIAENTKLSGMMDVEKTADRTEARKRVAERLGMDWRELEKVLTPIESAYAVADHTKAIAFLLAEGVVPSNVREGYLTRLLIRRTYRMLRQLGIEDRLPEIVEMQVSYWGADFPNLREMRNEVLEALTVEKRKYSRTLEKGSELVRRVTNGLKSKERKEFPLGMLIELYDSHGLVPEIVKEIAEPQGVAVSIPGNFFGKVAQRHLAEPVTDETDIAKQLKEKVSNLPETVPLYYKDPYMRECDARVLASFDGKYVALDQTCFYPEGGGQPTDLGVITHTGGTARVLDVQRAGSVLVHVVDGSLPKVGDVIRASIDWERRISLMRHHTGTHVLLGAATRVLGQHVWQAGAQKGVENSRLDISHYERITDEQLNEIERLACEAILRNIPVETSWMPREKAEQTYGFRLYQGGAVPGREIRLVKTGDWDVEACGGTHCGNTGELGIIKILRTERIQDGVERLIFATGTAALQAIQERDRILSRTAEALEAPMEKVEEYARTLMEERARLSKRLAEMRESLASRDAQALLKEAKNVGKVRLAVAKRMAGDEEDMIALADKIVKSDPRCVAILVLVKETGRIFVSAGKEAMKAGVHAGKLASELAKIVGGGGGGKPYFGQGGGTRIEKADEVLASARRALLSQLRK